MPRFAPLAACLLLALGSAFATPVRAQSLSVLPDAPPPGMLRLGDLWNLTLVNPGPGTVSAVLQAQVRDERGALVFEARTGAREFAPGTRRLTSRDLEPITISVVAPSVETAIARSGAFPDGRYSVCLEPLITGGVPAGAAACLDVAVASVMPPIPMEPPNGGTTSQPFVVYTYFMQTETSAGEAVACDLRVAEVIAGQSPEEALRANPPVLVRTGVRSLVCQTPDAARSLRDGRTYAWRITAKVGSRVAAESEIWTFTYREPRAESSAPQTAPADEVPPSGDSSGALPAAAGGDGSAGTPADSLPRALEWRAVARTTLESANRPGSLSPRAASFARLEVTPTLSIYGSPLALELLLSNENDPQRTEIQRGSLGLERARGGVGFDLRQRIESRVEALEKTRAALRADSTRLVRDELERMEGELAQLQALRPLEPAQSARELEQLGLVSASEATLMRIPRFAFGNVAPDFGRLFLSGVTLNGGQVEHQPGRLYGAAAFGKLPRENVDPGAVLPTQPDGSPVELFQDLVALRVGYGRREKSHLVLSGLHARDDRSARAVLALADPLLPVAEQENWVLGLAGRTRNRDGSVLLDGDVEASLFTGDRGGAEVEGRPAPGALRLLFGDRLLENSAADWAGSLRALADVARWRARWTSGLRFVGPGYRTVGARGLRRDLLEYEGSWDQSWGNGGLALASQWGIGRTGVVLPQSGSSTIRRIGLRATGRPSRLPAFELGYSIHDQEQQAGGGEQVLERQSTHVSARLRQAGHLGAARSLTMLSADRIEGISNDVNGSHLATVLLVSHMVSLPARIGLLARASRSLTRTALLDGADPDVWSWEGSVNWARGWWLDGSAGITGSSSGGLRQRGGFLGARLALGRAGTLDVQWSFNDARSLVPETPGFLDRVLRVQLVSGAARAGPGAPAAGS